MIMLSHDTVVRALCNNKGSMVMECLDVERLTAAENHTPKLQTEPQDSLCLSPVMPP